MQPEIILKWRNFHVKVSSPKRFFKKMMINAVYTDKKQESSYEETSLTDDSNVIT